MQELHFHIDGFADWFDSKEDAMQEILVADLRDPDTDEFIPFFSCTDEFCNREQSGPNG